MQIAAFDDQPVNSCFCATMGKRPSLVTEVEVPEKCLSDKGTLVTSASVMSYKFSIIPNI